jgi:hypothetical protein
MMTSCRDAHKVGPGETVPEELHQKDHSREHASKVITAPLLKNNVLPCFSKKK